ncbi:MAG: hypothetical protein ACI4LC_05965 [Emergencia sp.]
MKVIKSSVDADTEYWLSGERMIMVRNDDAMVINYLDIPRIAGRFFEGIRMELMSIYHEFTGIPQSMEEKIVEARCKGLTYGQLQAQKYIEKMRKEENEKLQELPT